MVKLGDAARFTGGDLPDIGTPHKLDLAAFQVWEKAREAINLTKDGPWPRDGRPGRMVEGLSVSGIIAELWPAMQDRIAYQLDPNHQTRAKDIGLALNRHLRETVNLVCMQRPGMKRKAVWWVADRYTSTLYSSTAQAIGNEQEQEEMDPTAFSHVETVVPIQAAPKNSIPRATFQAPPAMPVVEDEVNDTEENRKDDVKKTTITKTKGSHNGHLSSDKLVCRGADNCGQEFDYPQLRVSHEKRIHGKVFNPDGELVSSFDVTAAPLTDEDVRLMISMVLEASKQPMPMRMILSATRELDPRVTQPMVRRVLENNVDNPGTGIKLGPTIGTGVYTYYEFEKPVAAAAAATANGPVINLIKTIETEKIEDTTVTVTAPATSSTNDGTLAGVIVTLDDALIALRAMEAQEAHLAAQAAEHEQSAGELAKVTAERDKALADLRVANAVLTATRQERDQLRATIDQMTASLNLGDHQG